MCGISLPFRSEGCQPLSAALKRLIKFSYSPTCLESGIMTLTMVPFPGIPLIVSVPPSNRTLSRIPKIPSDVVAESCSSLIPWPLSRTSRIRSPFSLPVARPPALRPRAERHWLASLERCEKVLWRALGPALCPHPEGRFGTSFRFEFESLWQPIQRPPSSPGRPEFPAAARSRFVERSESSHPRVS